MPAKLLLTAVAVLLLPISASAADEAVRHGKWEVTMTMDIPGMPANMMKPMTTTSCVTKEEAADMEKSLPRASNDDSCKVADLKQDGGKISYTMKCKNGTVVKGDMSYKANTYEGTMITTTEGQTVTMKMKGKRLGDCTKK